MSEEKEAPSGLLEAFDQAIEALSGESTHYALIGGFAVAYHGIPRPTRDVDILLSVPRLSLPGLLQRFRDRGFDFSTERVLRELGEDHLSGMVRGKVRVDLLDAVIPLFRRTVEEARLDTIRGRQVRIARPEDLIALKMLAAREDDLRDIRGILAVQRNRLVLDTIRRSIEECCDKDRVELFEKLLRESSSEPGRPGSAE